MSLPELFQVKVMGKPFHCPCGSNVFRKENPDTLTFICNACGKYYEGELDEPKPLGTMTQWSDDTRVLSVKRKARKILGEVERLAETVQWHGEDMSGSENEAAVNYMRAVHEILLNVSGALKSVS